MELTIQSVLQLARRPEAYLRTIDDVELRPVEGKGMGMFSTRARPVGELVCKLDGQVIDSELYPELMLALEWNALSERRLLVRAVRTSYGYINHAREPNLGIDPDGVHMRVRRAIAAGEELTLDYLAPPVPQAYLDSEEGRLLAGRG
ncbi:MAG: SET domain-containing protein [Polyangiales bacterium]